MHGPSAPIDVTWVGDRVLRVSFAEGISDEGLARVRAAASALERASVPALVDVTPAYATVLLTFDLAALRPEAAEAGVVRAIAGASDAATFPERLVEIPVRYGGEDGPDLEDVARVRGLSPADVVRLHHEAEYRVAFLGFSPGFPYLVGLPEALATPRLPRPRVRVPAGSVAIAGRQAGVYPQETPGGWRILGRTELRLFDPAREPPSLLSGGDRVRFVPA
jgi:KipI family sensor histidine kinase inhibitor